MFTMGYIGTGHMGGALARAAAKSLPGEELVLANRTAAKAEALAAELGCRTSDDAGVCEGGRYLMLGVKPQRMAAVLGEMTPILQARKDRFILVTMAAGLTMAQIAAMAGGDYPVIRIMPNTPCAMGQGVILCCKNALVTEEEYAAFRDIMAPAGLLLDMEESLIDAGSAVSGCGPAFVYTFIETMADAGVACGLTRDQALQLSAATVQGSAAMVRCSDLHPAQLRDQVCSPGGSTIAGVLRMEEMGFRAAVADGVRASFEKTKELGK